MNELVHYAVADGVATITLDSQHNKNALSRQLVAELLERLDRAEKDDDAKVVLVRAEGRAFCSGADRRETVGGRDVLKRFERARAAHAIGYRPWWMARSPRTKRAGSAILGCWNCATCRYKPGCSSSISRSDVRLMIPAP